MSTLLTIISIISCIILLLLIIAYFSKRGYSIHREILIKKPISEVFGFLKNLKNQDYYSKWVMTDPDMKREYYGIDGTIGFIYTWDGNKEAGKGEQEIKGIIEDELVDVEVRFIRPFEGIAYTPIRTSALSENETKVSWGMKSEMKYPMNMMLWFLNMEKLLGPDLELSLNNLKSILESK